MPSSNGWSITKPRDSLPYVIDVLAGVGDDQIARRSAAAARRSLAGEPDHRDQFMTAAEHARNDNFTPCCSRSNSPRLVLDL